MFLECRAVDLVCTLEMSKLEVEGGKDTGLVGDVGHVGSAVDAHGRALFDIRSELPVGLQRDGLERLLVVQGWSQVTAHCHRFEVLGSHYGAHARAGCGTVLVVDDGSDEG